MNVLPGAVVDVSWEREEKAGAPAGGEGDGVGSCMVDLWI